MSDSPQHESYYMRRARETRHRAMSAPEQLRAQLLELAAIYETKAVYAWRSDPKRLR